MQYRRLADLEVSVLCLGAWMFGGHTPREEALRIIESAREAGVNFIDTADVYADGESERIVGAALAGDRERWVVATKVGGASSGTGRLARSSMMAAIEGSRQRLQMDCVDIYYLHQPDPETEIDETLETLGELIAGGKVRHFGISNFAGWEMADMVHRCRRLGCRSRSSAALLQHPEPGRRSRDLSRRPPLRDRGGGLQPARRRPADRQVPWRGRERRARDER